jgi:hypothetical protein
MRPIDSTDHSFCPLPKRGSRQQALQSVHA